MLYRQNPLNNENDLLLFQFFEYMVGRMKMAAVRVQNSEAVIKIFLFKYIFYWEDDRQQHKK